jgi:hypothetical protein
MIVNQVLGATALGTNPGQPAVTTTPPGGYAANSWPQENLLSVPLVTGMPQVTYIPVPHGSQVTAAWVDPVIAFAVGATLSLGNESGGDADFGTATIGTGTAALPLTGGNLAAVYAGTRGNSLKVSLSGPLSMEASTRKETAKDKEAAKEKENGKHKKEPDAKEVHPHAHPHAHPDAQPEASVETPPQVSAQAAPVTVGALNTAMNATTDSVVALQDGRPEVSPGVVLQIGTEQMTVVSVINASNFNVTRGTNGTTKAAHTPGNAVLINAPPFAAGASLAFLNVRFIVR